MALNKGFTFSLEPTFLGKIMPNMFRQDVELMDKALSDSFNKVIWNWPQPTIRRSDGKTVGSPRNIVDTGATRDSQKLLWENRFTATWEWDHPAAIIYDGRSDTDKYPARPFIDDALASTRELKFSKINFIGGLGTS